MDASEAFKLLSNDLSGESKKTSIAMLENLDEIIGKKNNNDMRGVYETVEIGMKLIKKIVPEIENKNISKSMSEFIEPGESMLQILKSQMENNDSESFFKTLESSFAKYADQIKAIHNNNQ